MGDLPNERIVITSSMSANNPVQVVFPAAREVCSVDRLLRPAPWILVKRIKPRIPIPSRVVSSRAIGMPGQSIFP